jgi:hypothetical protein
LDEVGIEIQIVEVWVGEPTDTAFVRVKHDLLIEPTGPINATDGYPRWPASKWGVSQGLLQTMIAALPPTRRANVLTVFGGSVPPTPASARSPEGSTTQFTLVPACQRWIVGTRPFAVALFDPQPDVAAWEGTGEASGVRVLGPLYSGTAQRGARFVEDADRAQRANIVIVFEDELEGQLGDWRKSGTTVTTSRATVYLLREPLLLGELIPALTDPTELQARSAKSVQIRPFWRW